MHEKRVLEFYGEKRKNFIVYANEANKDISVDEIYESWKQGNFLYPRDQENVHPGFRQPQQGAIFAIKSHWTVSNESATIVMPTGTGKTEVMIATIVSELCRKTLVIVPSDMLRRQTYSKICTLGKLKEIGATDQTFQTPHVGVLMGTPESKESLDELIRKSNVIVTTMSLLNHANFKDEYLALLATSCDTLMIDEAHHVPARSWTMIKNQLKELKCLQFTATPFRNDGLKIDGKIIYNFPLLQAQKQHYFKPINFYPILEFDEDRKDLAVAKKAVELLKSDRKKGLPHLLLVRASTKVRATQLFNDIYNRFFSEYKPVLIISDNNRMNQNYIDMVKSGKSKIVVCVDMFSEGIDIPQLKICAIHDKYKSLPVTIQFIGRFARTEKELGDASIVANIADSDIQESLELLYSQDADWNKLLQDMSADTIEREVELQELARGFTGTEAIPINQIRPKISMCMYKTQVETWNWKNWTKVFDPEHCNYYINEQEKMLIITELVGQKVEWSDCRDILDQNWNLHILYWNQEKGVFFIHTTEKGKADKFADAIFTSSNRIVGEPIFRCFSDIKRLMLSTVGLKTAVSNHFIRYRMFAGVDIAEGITNANTNSSTKSNIFGIGFEDGKSVSIGCSYKGTVWARLVNTIDFWKKWCDLQGSKILDTSINTESVLEGALVPQEIENRPQIMPYRIDFPDEIYSNSNSPLVLKTIAYSCPMCFADIQLVNPSLTGPITFTVKADRFEEIFSFSISNYHYAVKHESGSKISLGKKTVGHYEYLEDYFQDNPPVIWFVDGSSLYGRLLVQLKKDGRVKFPREKIKRWDWTGVKIRKESQGPDKITDSVQYKVISMLKASGEYCLIFDDDGSGEVADVVAVKEDTEKKKLKFELYHCKFSGKDKTGARVTDLYEVCGQAEKCIKWFNDVKGTLDRLLARDQAMRDRYNASRFEVGNEKTIYLLKNKLKFYKVTYDVFIVQPGVDGSTITAEMEQILSGAEAFLNETSGASFTMICS